MASSIRPASPDDATGIAEIYAPIVRDTHLSAEIEPPSVEQMRRRIETATDTHPWLVADTDGRITGYASATTFRARLAYQWCAEVSVYIHEEFRRQGLGTRLYAELLERLRVNNHRHAVAVIALPNAPSVAMHEQMGFVPVGVFPGLCQKFGRWYDIGWWRLPLTTDH